MVNGMRGMRMYKDQKGVVFDVPDQNIEKFEDVFLHLKEEKRIDFFVGRAKELPELKEDTDFPQVQSGYGGGYGGRNGYGQHAHN